MRRGRILLAVVWGATLAAAFMAGRVWPERDQRERSLSPASGAAVEWNRDDVVLVTDAGATVVEVLRADAERAREVAWSRDGRLAGVLVGGGFGSRLVTIDVRGSRKLYSLPLVEDERREARGITFSDNAASLVFDDCPKQGAGCRGRVLALPRVEN